MPESTSKKPLLAVVAVIVVLAVGAGAWYFLRDTSDPTASIDAVGAGQNQGSGAPAGPARTSADGSWKVQQGDSVFVGYRVNETFAAGARKVTANGRTPAVTGTMTVQGSTIPTAEFTADVSKLKSDEDRRDNAIRSRGLETEKFPQATFTLTEPIALPSAPSSGAVLNVTAKGDLTLHGQTKPVEVPLQAKWEGGTISVATVGEGIPVAFADYGIEPISIANFVSTEDRGTIELQLLFVPA